jgi:acyl-CoA thioesterase-1
MIVIQRLILLVLVLGALAARAETPPTLVVLGDSLSAAYGIDLGAGWVALLNKRLATESHPHEVVNASISGETTSGALARIDGILERHQPSLVIVELGGNDGLRGIALPEMRANLVAILNRIQDAGAEALLVEMRLPPNYGPRYTQRFTEAFTAIGEELAVPVSRFILDGIADDPRLMQADGIHPRAAAQERMLENLWPSMLPLLDGKAYAESE